jgi:integrase
MATIKITEKAVSALPSATGKQELFWDTELSGFGVLVSGATNIKTYVAQASLKGNRRRVTIGRCDRLKTAAARDKAREVLAQMALGEDPKAKAATVTLQSALDTYCEARRAKIKAATLDGYRRDCRIYLSDWLKRPLSEITSDMIETRHASIADEIRERQANPDPRAGQARANGVMRVFRLLYSHAEVRREDLPPNPARRLKRAWFKVPRRQRVVKFEDMPTFYAAIGSLENTIAADYIRFLLFTGLRRREAAALKWSEIDFGNKAFTIPAERTKAGRALTLPMSDLVSDLLVARRSIGKSSNDFVFFANSESGHIEEPKFAFDQIEEATGIKSSPHDLRRVFATVADSCEISALAIKALMNHAQPSDVTSGYIITSAERLRKPAQMIADKITELCQIEPPAGENVAALKR